MVYMTLVYMTMVYMTLKVHDFENTRFWNLEDYLEDYKKKIIL